MVFSSIHGFIDPPSWSHSHSQNPNHHQHQLLLGSEAENNQNQNQQLQVPLPPPPPQTGGGGGGVGNGGPGLIKPGSMTERARLAKIPQPEAGLKCPRCESTNTKFCYFNNYSLTQPRHFCKTCRRYWTRGGAMRNVPVGGGCRRSSKRSSKGGSNRSKSPAGSTNSTSTVSSNSCTTDMICHLAPPPPPPQAGHNNHMPFLGSLHHLNDFGNISLNFEGLQIPSLPASGAESSILSSGPVTVADHSQWKIPFFANGFYGFTGDDVDFSNYQAGLGGVGGGGGGGGAVGLGLGQLRYNNINNVKMEDTQNQTQTHQGLNLSRNFLGIQGNDQFWSTGAAAGGGDGGGGNQNGWTADQISDHFNSSSSTSHPHLL